MRLLRRSILVVVVVLTACVPVQTPALVLTQPPTAARLPTKPSPASAPTANPSALPAPTQAEASPTATTSTTFDPATWDWNDRSPFAAGLIPSEQSVVEAMAGAPLYVLTLDIAASLSSVSGEATIYYTNQEETALDAIWFHLHPNVLGGRMTVSSVSVGDRPAGELHYAAGNSALEVPLAAPLRPGEQVTLQLDFAVEVPTILDRNYGVLAATDGVLALAHFYPMAAVFDDDGGWNTDPPAPQGDLTYGDASFFAVTVRAPAALVIAAAGWQAASQMEDNRQTRVYLAGPARDFYLAASADYTLVGREWNGVRLNSYAPASRTDTAETALDYAAAALETFSGRYGPYPYRELDLVAIPTLALGIEYPGLIAMNRDLYDPAHDFGETPSAVLLESTTVHEVGHQWFYNLVGNDQLDEPWLDEALTQYATWRYYADVYGSGGEQGFGQALDGRWARVDHALIPIGLPVSAYEGAEYGAIVYGRGPLFFDALAQQMGEQIMASFLRDYAQQYRWRIATGEDLKALGETHCACDLTPLFAEWVWK